MFSKVVWWKKIDKNAQYQVLVELLEKKQLVQKSFPQQFKALELLEIETQEERRVL
ncbi:hypothetical protein [Thermococcus sp.]|uniref:hypothetical protein n=1 Tax=Thermococcus sp. TaxID=35749 RepID=UPI0019A5AF3E|nr:hypothetical protein [Thermococcus sp.]MBC7094868.1 hypothetical protein [Thermococcus sp.]